MNLHEVEYVTYESEESTLPHVLPSRHTKLYLVCWNIICAHGLLFSWFHISLTPWLQIGRKELLY